MNTLFHHRIPAGILFVLLLITSGVLFSASALAQDQPYIKKPDVSGNRQKGLSLLRQIRDILKEEYYDPTFHGIDLDRVVQEAEKKINGQEQNWQIYRTIASVIDSLGDSHTRFLPPGRMFRVEYGFSTMMIGQRCFVSYVKKGSDADVKGVRPGDEVRAIGGIAPTRASYDTINYIIYGLDPQEVVKIKLLNADGQEKEFDVRSRFISPEQRRSEQKKLNDDEQQKPYACRELAPDLLACKLRTFDIERETVDRMMKEVRGRRRLILDLRGNGGGRLDTLTYFTSYFFDHDVTIGKERFRNKSKEVVAKSKKGAAFTGDLAVLIDSNSASASEIFARTIQLEKRGTLYGDTSMGAVTAAMAYGITTSTVNMRLSFGNTYYEVAFFQYTVADFIMRDGGRIEGSGVSPDIPLGPTSVAIASNADPVLAYAAGLLGTKITGEQAGEFHFLLPKTEDRADINDGDGMKSLYRPN